jgi:hypothetical protein
MKQQITSKLIIKSNTGRTGYGAATPFRKMVSAGFAGKIPTSLRRQGSVILRKPCTSRLTSDRVSDFCFRQQLQTLSVTHPSSSLKSKLTYDSFLMGKATGTKI